ncbi:MAG: type III-A CRISPR-associated RAMP protein Csm5 [Bacteroidota bacterium]
MQYKIQITTLTPVHIGSGAVLRKNMDFIQRENKLHIIDYNKLGKILNKKQIDLLTSYIENDEPITKALPQDLPYERYSKKTIPLHTNTSVLDFHEFITNAIHQPYIPGSSIKGYINTVLFREYVKARYKEKKLGLNSFHSRWSEKEQKREYNFKDKNILGEMNNEQTHLSRFYRFSDAHFQSGTTYVDIINTYVLTPEDDWEKRPNLQNLAELIPSGELSHLTLQIPDEKTPFHHTITEKIKQHLPHTFQKYFPLKIHHLFSLINQHTKALIEKEISILETTNEPFSETYENKLAEISEKLEKENQNNSPDTAILRIGKFTGFNNLTGNWQEGYMEVEAYNQLIEQLNGKTNISLFPKSRRCTSKGEPIGFVELKLVDNS